MNELNILDFSNNSLVALRSAAVVYIQLRFTMQFTIYKNAKAIFFIAN